MCIFLFGIPCLTLNCDSGQLESTLLRTASRNSNLLAILDDDETLRIAVKELLAALKSIQTEDLRGSQLSAVLNHSQDFRISALKGTRQALSSDYFNHLSSFLRSLGQIDIVNEVLSFEQISFRGVCYGTHQSPHFCDSGVIFEVAGSPLSEHTQGSNRAGRIESIFEYECWVAGELVKKMLVFVKEYLPVQRPAFQDPYPKYGFAAGFLCEGQANRLCLIELSQIVSHFALTTFPDEGLIHVMPVDRVSCFLSTCCQRTDYLPTYIAYALFSNPEPWFWLTRAA